MTQDWRDAVAARCRQHPTCTAVAATETGLVIVLGDRTLLLDPDLDDPGRAALWVELTPPAGLSAANLAAAAMRYTAARLTPAGYAMGFNAKAGLLLLGRSLELEQFGAPSGPALLDQLDAEAAAADAMFRGVEPPAPPNDTGVDPRFAVYVQTALQALGLDAPALTRNRLMMQIEERWLEVIFNPDDARLVLVGIVAMSNPVRAKLLGQFNAYNLFHGGYALISPPGTGAVYLCQSHSLASVPPDALGPLLVQFETRAGAAGTWYLTYEPEPAHAHT